MPNPNPIRIGTIGCGSVMQRPYTRLINQLKMQGKVETIVACDVREERRELGAEPRLRLSTLHHRL